ncbi:thiamine/thiamine pyrophosphate ABC transporter permease ThiP [Pseudooceanicola sp. LIPI14-2-Ac024]|uniref:thiamine/thiamine pyrophosphate ABC transporter permease ThiP n=1 Tax=Pseudooceanicola sp. LIPI14-2-Ac024 TaxID=3344875 RepID=UPI0035CEF7C5
MAAGAVALSRGWPGRVAAICVAAFLLLPLLAVIWRAEGIGWPDPGDMAAVRFTVVQALLSAGLSCLLAVPVARALARRRFALRSLYIGLMGAPFILPVIVAVLGLIAVFGQGGIVNALLRPLGVGPVTIYGLHGVVLAHVFFNLPLAVRLILQGWQEIPGERFRLAAQIGAGPRDIWRLLERPMLAAVLPGVFTVIFAICLTSFAVALTLGGGPRSTTVELAIYQAFRFEFDLGRAAVLSVIQLCLVIAAGLIALRVTRGEGFGTGLDRVVDRWDARGRVARGLDTIWLGLAAVFLLAPLLSVLVRGIAELGDLPGTVWSAAGASVAVALGATGLTMVCALAMALARRGWVEVIGLLPLAASPLVLGTGLFILINPIVRPSDLALLVTMAVNVVMALPFALRILGPAAAGVERDYGRLADSLGLEGMARLRWLILPRLRRPLGFAAGLTAALSMGDLGVIALFADPQVSTLPLTVYRLMGAYQMQAAAGAAVLLLGLSFGLFALFDFGGRWRADT